VLFLWNIGTFYVMPRENFISGNPTKEESTDAHKGGGLSRSVCVAAWLSGGLKSH